MEAEPLTGAAMTGAAGATVSIVTVTVLPGSAVPENAGVLSLVSALLAGVVTAGAVGYRRMVVRRDALDGLEVPSALLAVTLKV